MNRSEQMASSGPTGAAPAQQGPSPIGVPGDYQVPIAGGGAGPAQPPRYFEGDEMLPASMSQEERTHLINQMVDAGLLPASYRNSGVWDGTVRNAYGEVLAFANGSGRDAQGALEEMKASAPEGAGEGEANQPIVIGGNVGGGNVYTVQLSDPATLRSVADKAARAVLGRKPKKDEMDKIVAAITGAEVAVQEKVDAVLEGKSQEKFTAQTNAEATNAAARAGATATPAATSAAGGKPTTIISPVPGVTAPADTMGAPRSGGRSHKGTDIFGKKGSPAVAPIGGTVVQAGSSGLGGLRIWIQGDDGRFHYLAHLDRIDVKKGQRIEQGVQIGTVGNTGNAKSTPAHIHYSINSQMGSEDAIGNPAQELAGGGGGGGHEGHDHAADAPDVIQTPNTYIAPVTVGVENIDPQARAEEQLRADNPVEAGAHDLAADVYGSFLSIIGAR